jgi:hypothetical protein
MTNSNFAAEDTDDQRPATAPTHIMYTPVWEPDGGKFRKWLPIGNLWLDERSQMFGEIEAVPVNAEETATGYFQFVPVGEKPPAPLTVTREEFEEQQPLARPWISRPPPKPRQ